MPIQTGSNSLKLAFMGVSKKKYIYPSKVLIELYSLILLFKELVSWPKTPALDVL